MTRRRIQWQRSMVLGVIAGGAAVVALIAACRSAPQAAAPMHNAPGRTIVRLVGRDLTITISAGHRNTLYSATTNRGTVLATNLTLDQLRDRHPEVYRQVQPALCADAGAGNAISDRLWAGMGE